MTSAQHAAWIRAGQHWQLARPLAALRDRLRRYGYTVYDLGDNRHLDHIPPEDHTPYSETGWPGRTPYGWVTAIDIMPPANAALPSLQALGGQIFADMQANFAGVKWLKYMNWGPTSDNTAVHDQWELKHVRTSSGDTGHAHLSCRSDATQWTIGDNYDPVARLRGQKEEDMTAMTRAFYDLFTALAVGVTEDGFVAAVGDPNTENANIDAVVRDSANYTLKTLAVKLDALTAALKVPTPIAPTAEQWAAFTAEVREQIEATAEAAAERAVRNVLGGLDNPQGPTASGTTPGR